MNEIVRPGIVLFIISLIASLSLGFVNEITKGPIEIMEKKAETDAQQELLPDATSFEELENIEFTNSVRKVVAGKNGDELIGYIFSVYPVGYSGEITIAVAIDSEGAVEGAKILNHSETPGLGANAVNPEFIDQYKDKTGALTVTKQEPQNDTEIHAITSATITSEAVTTGVNDAYELYQQISE